MVVFSMIGSALSWLLGKLDTGYYFLGFGRQGLKFFESGYGDLEKTLRLVQLKGELAKEMLGDPTRAPKAAEKVMQELAEQQSAGVDIKGVSVLLPHTADQGKSARRKLYGDTLAAQGVVCIIVIAPFYGVRKPQEQKKWFLREVDDSFLQAVAIAVEAACLLHWARRTWGPAVPLAAAGVSFGGAMAGLCAKMFSGPVAIVPYMGCLGPGEPYTEGVLKSSVAWEKLQAPAFVTDARVPPPVLEGGTREDLSYLSPDEIAFCNYCRFVTDTRDLRDALPVGIWGQCVLYMVQARHDGFVPFKEGKALFDTLLYLSEGCPEAGAGGGGGGPSSEMVTIPGGHCAGFIRAPSLMSAAVLTALERLRVKHSM